MAPEPLLASADILAQIDKLRKRQFSDPHLADECYLYVLDELEAEVYAQLRELRGKSAEKTFVHALVARLGFDFKRDTPNLAICGW